MPQISPIMWLIPISALIILLISVNTNLSSSKESEKFTSFNPINSTNNQWNW